MLELRREARNNGTPQMEEEERDREAEYNRAAEYQAARLRREARKNRLDREDRGVLRPVRHEGRVQGR